MLHELPFVSIVIPFYNAQKTLEKCVASLLNLNFERERYEIILVNDCSTDDSVAMANRFTALHPNINMINLNERSGVNAARNRGILSAKGEIIAFTDSDCVVDAQWLKALVNRFDEADVGGVHGKTLPSGSSKSILFRVDAPVSTGGFFHETCNIAYRKDVLISIGLFDGRFSSPPWLYHRGDSDVAFSVEEKGLRILYEPEAIVYHPVKKIGLWRLGKKYRFDALLYKKHPERARGLLGVKVGFLTSNSLSLLASTASIIFMLYSLLVGDTLLQILGFGAIAAEYLVVYLLFYRDRGWRGFVGPIILYLYLVSSQLNRLYGSLKYRKLVF